MHRGVDESKLRSDLAKSLAGGRGFVWVDAAFSTAVDVGRRAIHRVLLLAGVNECELFASQATIRARESLFYLDELSYSLEYKRNRSCFAWSRLAAGRGGLIAVVK